MLREWADYLTLLRSGAFDPAYYLLTYRDCRLADVDPLWHFVAFGWREGRSPSAEFDTGFYLKKNLDVRKAGVNPLVHYLRFGQYEGRLPRAKFRPTPVTGMKRPKRARHLLYQAGKNVYWRIPAKARQNVLHWAYRRFGFLFRGMPHYENWRIGSAYGATTTQTALLDIHTVPEATEVKGRIAIHLHIFYAELAPEFASYLKNMPFAYDLYVSVGKSDALETCQRTFANLPLCRNVTVQAVENRGRDIAPIFCAFGQMLAEYDFIAHLHSKKSLYNKGATEGWREYLCHNLFGSPEQIRRIFTLLQDDPPYGIVYPQNYVLLPYWANTWLSNRQAGTAWCARLGIGEVPSGYFDYPASSMFWARGDALAPLFNAGIMLDDFPPEAGQTDGTLAHTLERMLVLASRKQGMEPGILKDEQNPAWSPWRLDIPLNRTFASMVATLHLPETRLIAFDIFDTLLSRPLINPETIKRLVAARVDAETGALYEAYRASAEGQARQAKGSDVGMDEIYTRLGELTQLPPARLVELRGLEEALEKASLEPRPEALALFREAQATGKPVILISDMFLPRALLEDVLHAHGFDGWQAIFVSNEVGLRKDEGKLYEHALAQFAVSPAQLLMIGDNERADIQIPVDMGASTLHLLRAVELARGLPRFSSLLTQHERQADLHAEMTLGLVIRKNFGTLQLLDLDPDSLIPATPYHLGYSLIGPLLVSFAQWLLEMARAYGIERLYFLSREGKPIQQVFDCWSAGMKETPRSEYLALSRRAAGFAAIASLEDIFDIARTVYFPNTLEKFLHTRYGIHLSDARWAELSQSLNIHRDTEITVENRQIDHLIPLLKALEGEIMARSTEERTALLRYLENMGLPQNDLQAVVDVGYSGSVQKYLNKLLSPVGQVRKVHGFYLMTDERAAKVAETYQVMLRGCFFENVQGSSNIPTMYRLSFDIEKLLSTNEAQIEYYEIDAAGQVSGHHRLLLPEELACADIRNQLVEGALNFAKDARHIRETMFPDFQPSKWTAQMLLEAFLSQRSFQENELLAQIILDDYYCGRDLVS